MPTLTELKRDKAKLKTRKKQAETFLKEIYSAKKAGYKNAKIGKTIYSIPSLIKRGKTAKQIAINRLNKIDKTISKKRK